MGNCNTCHSTMPGMVPVDGDTLERLPLLTSHLDYEIDEQGGQVGKPAGKRRHVAYLPCPECNQARRTIMLGARELAADYGKGVDRDGYPDRYTGDRQHPSWKPHLRGGDQRVPAAKQRPVLALVKGGERQIAKQGELLPEKGRKSPGI